MKLFFDLDGTLTDPGLGISRCIQHALSRMGRPVPAAAELMRFVGPPLRGTFAELLGTRQPELLDQAIAVYRERFATVGLFENEVYPGVREGLTRVQESGHELWVVTSKPTVFAQRIVAHFELAPFFRRVFGSELSGANADKGDLIRHVLTAEGLTRDTPWMIGDRRHDIVAAHASGLPAMGVLWGYGTRAELEGAGADRLVATMDELCGALEG